MEETIPEALSAGIDYVILGEAEETIKELLRDILANRDVDAVKGIAYLKDGKSFFTSKREPQKDFDKLPLPDFSLVKQRKVICLKRIGIDKNRAGTARSDDRAHLLHQAPRYGARRLRDKRSLRTTDRLKRFSVFFRSHFSHYADLSNAFYLFISCPPNIKAR